MRISVQSCITELETDGRTDWNSGWIRVEVCAHPVGQDGPPLPAREQQVPGPRVIWILMQLTSCNKEKLFIGAKQANKYRKKKRQQTNRQLDKQINRQKNVHNIQGSHGNLAQKENLSHTLKN